KGKPTEGTWIHDARANVPKITKKDRPLAASHFDGFEDCYGDNPHGLSKRTQADSPDGRWRPFSIKEIKARHYKLDSFKWLRDEDAENLDELAEPEELVAQTTKELRLALDE